MLSEGKFIPDYHSAWHCLAYMYMYIIGTCTWQLRNYHNWYNIIMFMYVPGVHMHIHMYT